MSKHMGNSKEFDKRWRKGRTRTKAARAARKRSRK